MTRTTHPGLPTVEAAETTARELLAGRHPRTWHRTKAVAAKADRLAQSLHLSELERQTLVTAAWLTRIGEATPTARHWAPIDGAAAADSWGYYRISSLLAWHSTSLEEATVNGQRPALFRYTRPDAHLADLLTYADMTVRSNGKDCTLNDHLVELRSSTLTADDHTHVAALTRGLPRIADIVSRIDKEIRFPHGRGY